MTNITSNNQQLISSNQVDNPMIEQEYSLPERNHQNTNPLTNTKEKIKCLAASVGAVGAVGVTASSAAIAATAVSNTVAGVKIASMGVIGKALSAAGVALSVSGSGFIAIPIVVGIGAFVGVGFLIHHAVKKFKEAQIIDVLKEAKMIDVLNEGIIKESIDGKGLNFIKNNSQLAGKIISEMIEKNEMPIINKMKLARAITSIEDINAFLSIRDGLTDCARSQIEVLAKNANKVALEDATKELNKYAHRINKESLKDSINLDFIDRGKNKYFQDGENLDLQSRKMLKNDLEKNYPKVLLCLTQIGMSNPLKSLTASDERIAACSKNYIQKFDITKENDEYIIEYNKKGTLPENVEECFYDVREAETFHGFHFSVQVSVNKNNQIKILNTNFKGVRYL